MKITKKQLRRIIKEEKAKLLREQHEPAPIDIMDKPEIQTQLVRLVDSFREDMQALWQGTPGEPDGYAGLPGKNQQEYEARVKMVADKLYDSMEELMYGAESDVYGAEW